MIYRPHAYQVAAIDFIRNHPVAAVLLDMGMGKTSIVLDALHDLMFSSFEVSRVLVIAPMRVARHTWPAEIRKWDHLRGIRYSVATGTAAERRRALKADADIYIINRENVSWLIERSGLPFDFDMVVIDELSSFKNGNSARFRALMKVRPGIRRVIGLTGTPSSNGLMDLFAEYKLLDMGERLGRFISRYRADFFVPDKVNGPVVYSYRLRPGAERIIHNRISDITISMRGTDYLNMPSLIMSEHKVWMDEKERSAYESLKRSLIVSLAGGEVTAANAASLSGKLTQMANGAVYSDSGIAERVHERKLDGLEDLIEAANGKSLLVAYWFRHDLARITERLTRLKVPFGRLDSDRGIEDWNAGRLRVGLIHPASAGHGLNIQSGGNTIVWFGLSWSLELYQQTNARLWRQGQKSDTVIVQHILTAGTIDERIMEALGAKERLQSRLLDAVKAEVMTDDGH